MKRKANLYKEIYKLENILQSYDEVCRNTRNKKKVARYKEHKCRNIYRVYYILKNKIYEPGKPYVFKIYEPKERVVESQNMEDKLVNHLVSRYILYPALLPCLIETNVASRKYKGTSAGLKYFKEFRDICNAKYGEYYILKCDIHKFFHSINKDILKQKVARRIKDKDALEIVNKIIDNEENGLGIGNMTSQVMAIFYLNDLDHYIKEDLKIKYYVRYQDDFLLFHPNKEYLKECLEKIKVFLVKDDLTLNKKTRIYKSTDNFVFLGRNNKGEYAKYRQAKRKLKKRFYLYAHKKIELNGIANSIINFNNLLKESF